jgi:stage II sporulation protein M
MVVGGAAIGGWAAGTFPLPAEAFSLSELTDPSAGSISDLVEETGLLSSFSTGAVFWNNVRSLIAAGVLAMLSLGILALLLLLAPAVIVAYLGMQVGRLGVNPLLFVVLGVLPHGLLELPAAILATAQAMRMGDVLLAPPDKGGGIAGVIREVGHFLKLFVALVLPLLLIAAWIEVNVTPRLFLSFLASQT